MVTGRGFSIFNLIGNHRRRGIAPVELSAPDENFEVWKAGFSDYVLSYGRQKMDYWRMTFARKLSFATAEGIGLH